MARDIVVRVITTTGTTSIESELLLHNDLLSYEAKANGSEPVSE